MNFNKEQEVLPFYIEPLFGPVTNEEEFIPHEKKTNDAGMEYQDFEKNLKPWLYGLFHSHTIRQFTGRDNNTHIYQGSGLNTQDQLLYMKLLVNAFFVKFGKDDNGEGGFSMDDVNAIMNDQWNGRNWLSKKIKNPVMINYSIEEGVQLTIWRKR